MSSELDLNSSNVRHQSLDNKSSSSTVIEVDGLLAERLMQRLKSHASLRFVIDLIAWIDDLRLEIRD